YDSQGDRGRSFHGTRFQGSPTAPGDHQGRPYYATTGPSRTCDVRRSWDSMAVVLAICSTRGYFPVTFCCNGAHNCLVDVGGWRRLGETCKYAGCSQHDPVHCGAISAVVYMLTEELYLPGR